MPLPTPPSTEIRVDDSSLQPDEPIPEDLQEMTDAEARANLENEVKAEFNQDLSQAPEAETEAEPVAETAQNVDAEARTNVENEVRAELNQDVPQAPEAEPVAETAQNVDAEARI